MHRSLVSLVVNDLRSQVPLLSLLEFKQDVFRTDLHDRDFLVQTFSSVGVLSAILISDDFFHAPSWNFSSSKYQSNRMSEGWITESSIFESERLVLSVWVPIVMGLDVSMIFTVRVIEISVKPGRLRDGSHVHWQLGNFVGRIDGVDSQRVECLVDVGVEELVSQIVVRLVPEVIWKNRTIDVQD